MPATIGFQLVQSDLAILQRVHELRLATIEHIAALSGRRISAPQTAWQSLKIRNT